MADGSVKIVMTETVVYEVEQPLAVFAELCGLETDEVQSFVEDSSNHDSTYGLVDCHDLLDAVIDPEHLKKFGGSLTVPERDWEISVEGLLSKEAQQVKAPGYEPEWED